MGIWNYLTVYILLLKGKIGWNHRGHLSVLLAIVLLLQCLVIINAWSGCYPIIGDTLRCRVVLFLSDLLLIEVLIASFLASLAPLSLIAIIATIKTAI